MFPNGNKTEELFQQTLSLFSVQLTNCMLVQVNISATT